MTFTIFIINFELNLFYINILSIILLFYLLICLNCNERYFFLVQITMHIIKIYKIILLLFLNIQILKFLYSIMAF